MVVQEEVSADLTNSKSRIKSKLIEESQNDHYKKYSMFENLQNGIKQKCRYFIVYNLAI